MWPVFTVCMEYLYKAKGEYEPAVNNFLVALRYDLQTADRATSASVLKEVGTIYLNETKQNRHALYYFFEGLKYARAADSVNILGNIAQRICGYGPIRFCVFLFPFGVEYN